MTIRRLSVMLAVCLLTTVDVVHGEEDNKIEIGDIAKEIVARSTTNSQVLSLNLTNLVILLVLKGLLFGAAMLGHQRGRIAEEEPLMSAPELMLLTSYLMADSAKQDYHCLHRVACQEPAKAKQYLAAAKILLRAGKMFEPVLPYDSKYERLVEDMQEAVDFGTKYGTCGQKYTCSENRKSK